MWWRGRVDGDSRKDAQKKRMIGKQRESSMDISQDSKRRG